MAQPPAGAERSAECVGTTVPVVRVSVGRAFLVREIAKPATAAGSYSPITVPSLAACIWHMTA